MHALLNWVIVARLGRGLLGASMVGNASWWLINMAQFVYVVSGSFPKAWTGFSRKAFASLCGLEICYYTTVIDAMAEQEDSVAVHDLVFIFSALDSLLMCRFMTALHILVAGCTCHFSSSIMHYLQLVK